MVHQLQCHVSAGILPLPTLAKACSFSDAAILTLLPYLPSVFHLLLGREAWGHEKWSTCCWSTKVTWALHASHVSMFKGHVLYRERGWQLRNLCDTMAAHTLAKNKGLEVLLALKEICLMTVSWFLLLDIISHKFQTMSIKQICSSKVRGDDLLVCPPAEREEGAITLCKVHVTFQYCTKLLVSNWPRTTHSMKCTKTVPKSSRML